MYNANLDMCTWTFAKTLARKKFLSPFQKRTLAETVNCIPKGLRKGNPFQGPFAQLSYIPQINAGSKHRKKIRATQSLIDGSLRTNIPLLSAIHRRHV